MGRMYDWILRLIHIDLFIVVYVQLTSGTYLSSFSHLSPFLVFSFLPCLSRFIITPKLKFKTSMQNFIHTAPELVKKKLCQYRTLVHSHAGDWEASVHWWKCIWARWHGRPFCFNCKSLPWFVLIKPVLCILFTMGTGVWKCWTLPTAVVFLPIISVNFVSLSPNKPNERGTNLQHCTFFSDLQDYLKKHSFKMPLVFWLARCETAAITFNRVSREPDGTHAKTPFWLQALLLWWIMVVTTQSRGGWGRWLIKWLGSVPVSACAGTGDWEHTGGLCWHRGQGTVLPVAWSGQHRGCEGSWCWHLTYQPMDWKRQSCRL